MDQVPADPQDEDSGESAMRRELARGEAAMASVAPVLGYLLASDDQALFGDDILARLRGMMADMALQLCSRAVREAGGVLPVLPDEPAVLALMASLARAPALLEHLHALALEWRLTERLQGQLALDPVLSPLLQVLIASDADKVSALARHVLAAQARFAQNQRRMQIPLGELPPEVLDLALAAMRTHATAPAGHDGGGVAAWAERAEAAIRDSYDESATRLGLLSRLVAVLDEGAVAALRPDHAGLALFATALAQASGQSREESLWSMQEGLTSRLALALRSAGLSVGQIGEIMLALHAAAVPPAGVLRISPERARILLHAMARPHPAGTGG